MTRRRIAGTGALALLAACAPAATRAPVPTEYHRVGALEVSAVVERNQMEVLGAVELMNTGADTIRLEYAGYCALALLMYPADAAIREPRWDSAEWWMGQGECPEGNFRVDIPPITLARIIAPVIETGRILGDSLPGGSYTGAVRLRIVQPHDTTLVLLGGPVRLEREAAAAGRSLAALPSVDYPTATPNTSPIAGMER
jgi:hypothetical protein